MSAVRLPEFELLPMREPDLEAVLVIESEIYGFPWTRGNFHDALKAGYSGWVLRRGTEAIGYAVVMMALDEAHLLNISIATRLQRQGHGARLLSHVMNVAEKNGATSLLLEVRPSNLRAIDLYRNFGFEEIGVRRGYYPAATGREDAVVFRRFLSETLA